MKIRIPIFTREPITGPISFLSKDSRLETCLTEYSRQTIGLYAVYPSTRNLSAKVRVFIDLLVERFGDEPFWDRAIFKDGK
jgi:DNA-binding transcriptional LysR family regulator